MNPLYFSSRVKSYLLKFLIEKRPSKSYLSAISSLKYPAELNLARKKVYEYFELDANDSSEDGGLFTKQQMKALSRRDLLLLHKYYNYNLDFHHGVAVFHELIRRDIRMADWKSQNAIKRLLLGLILLEGILPKRRLSAKSVSFIMYLLIKSSNKNKNPHAAKKIAKRDISVVGGGIPSYDDYDDISRGDCIASLNNISDDLMVGDIVYYRGERLKFIDDKNLWPTLKGFNAFLSFKLPLLIKKVEGQNVAVTTSADLACDYGTFNAIPTICIDLFRYKARSVTLYRVDFNLGGWAENYRPNGLMKIRKDLIFGEHPACLQFAMVKGLHRHYNIKLSKNNYISLSDSYRKFCLTFSSKSQKIS
jgi:hypothetical protein